MLTIGDIVALAKAGYKPADVKELMQMTEESKEEKTIPQDPPSNVVPEAAAETAPSAAAEPEPPKAEEDPIDYKALYESAKIDLDKAQKANMARDISSAEDNLSDEDLLKDLFKEFM